MQGFRCAKPGVQVRRARRNCLPWVRGSGAAAHNKDLCGRNPNPQVTSPTPSWLHPGIYSCTRGPMPHRAFGRAAPPSPSQSEGSRRTAMGPRVAFAMPHRRLHCITQSECLASGGSDTAIRIWDLEGGEDAQCLEFRGHSSRIWDIARGSGTLLASASGDGSVKLWDYDRPSCPLLATLDGHQGDVYSVRFHPCYSKIVSAGYDACARLWDVETRRELSTFRCHQAPITSVVFNKYGNLVATGSKDGTVKFTDCTYGVETMSLALPSTSAQVPCASLLHADSVSAARGGEGG